LRQGFEKKENYKKRSAVMEVIKEGVIALGKGSDEFNQRRRDQDCEKRGELSTKLVGGRECRELGDHRRMLNNGSRPCQTFPGWETEDFLGYRGNRKQK